MSKTTQCVNVPFGASGSSMISANDRASRGGSVHVSGGGVLSPSHVKIRGMSPPATKAGLEIVNAIRRPSARAEDLHTLDVAAGRKTARARRNVSEITVRNQVHLRSGARGGTARRRSRRNAVERSAIGERLVRRDADVDRDALIPLRANLQTMRTGGKREGAASLDVGHGADIVRIDEYLRFV